ncbi:MAG: hypothetical protein NTY48_03850 [Candidatus Diapherotrites archaeon]|nr:hypothetical protein [Candidatus Diapherotrites archaeon]
MQRGQAVLEFLFIILIIVVYLTTTALPLEKDAKNAVYDSSRLARANVETQKLSSAVQEVSEMGAGTRETIAIFVPEKTIITCDTGLNKIDFNLMLELEQNSAQCPSNICIKEFLAPEGTTLNCTTQKLYGPAKYTIKIEKTALNAILFERTS